MGNNQISRSNSAHDMKGVGMIEAKGTKSVKEDEPHQRYTWKNDKGSSRTPAVIALFLTGFALYLKSAFSSAPGLEERRSNVGTPLEENLPPSKLITGSIPALVKEEEKPEAPAEKKTNGGIRSNNGPASEEIELVDFQPFGFPTGETPKPTFQLREQGAPLPSFIASNDNVASREDGSVATTSDAAPDGRDHEPDEDPDDEDDDDNDNDEDEDDDDDDEDDDDEDDDDEGVSPINGAPRVNGTLVLMDVSGCAAVLIGLSDLLRGASDPRRNSTDNHRYCRQQWSVGAGRGRQPGEFDAWHGQNGEDDGKGSGQVPAQHHPYGVAHAGRTCRRVG